jgi:coproporphyrinogen III oxidase-like Fe-S oxidoreductase
MLTLEKNTPFYKKYNYDNYPIPITDDVAEMYKYAHNYLEN